MNEFNILEFIKNYGVILAIGLLVIIIIIVATVLIINKKSGKKLKNNQQKNEKTENTNLEQTQPLQPNVNGETNNNPDPTLMFNQNIDTKINQIPSAENVNNVELNPLPEQNSNVILEQAAAPVMETPSIEKQNEEASIVPEVSQPTEKLFVYNTQSIQQEETGTPVSEPSLSANIVSQQPEVIPTTPIEVNPLNNQMNVPKPEPTEQGDIASPQVQMPEQPVNINAVPEIVVNPQPELVLPTSNEPATLNSEVKILQPEITPQVIHEVPNLEPTSTTQQIIPEPTVNVIPGMGPTPEPIIQQPNLDNNQNNTAI